MEAINVPVKDGKAGFKLYLLELQEWGEVPPLFPQDQEVFQTEWFKQIYPTVNQTNEQLQERPSRIRPGVIRLRPGLHHALFSDQDRQGNIYPIRFFLTENEIIFVGHTLLRKEKVLEWANRGIINSPMDLAQIIGMRVLHHHETRLESIENQMERLEEEILTNPAARQQGKIFKLHRKVISLKKSLNHHLAAFERLGAIDTHIDTHSSSLWPELITETKRELENIRQTYELAESLREAYQAAVDNRANDIMKLLTLLATVLLPINLLTSFFGMNFTRMPLIGNPYGIYIFFAGCFFILVTVLFYFWRKDWLR
ncbi:magnesium transporter CorA family protein [Desulfitobacterium sp.]|uniref:magnesium transporter CorA family protein n=1 Tax=Desulfitobacterium sp. TaxID=49981 RepID=UPI002C35B9D2|nr:CorA family divalent cation transporter [Desulfitobacterium sp.]HVJ48384.1 CorA family divalent cation transporter [Desulfitobacterium sp.]